MEFAIWGEDSEKYDLKVGDIIVVKEARVAEY